MSTIATAGAVHVLDLESSSIVARLATGYSPDVAIDPTGKHLFVLSTQWDGAPRYGRTFLSFHDLPSLGERRRIEIQDRVLYPLPGPPGILVSADGRTIFVYHYVVLGDNSARYWVTAHDTTTGGSKGSFELGNCGAAFMAQGTDPTLLYVTCHQGRIHIVNTETWKEAASVEIPFQLNVKAPDWTEIAAAAISTDGSQYATVTRNLEVFLMELKSLKTHVIRRWAVPNKVVVPNQLALDASAARIWLATVEADGMLVTLTTGDGTRSDVKIPGIHSLTVLGDRMFLADSGHVKELKGTLDVEVVPNPSANARIWRLLPAA